MGNFSLQIQLWRDAAAVEINSYCLPIYEEKCCQIMTTFEASALNDGDFNAEGTNDFIFWICTLHTVKPDAV